MATAASDPRCAGCGCAWPHPLLYDVPGTPGAREGGRCPTCSFFGADRPPVPPVTYVAPPKQASLFEGE